MNEKRLSYFRLDKFLVLSLIITFLVRVLIYLLSITEVSSMQDFLEIWTKWDTSWYLSIAEHGYVTNGEEALSIVFYPGYPLFIRLANTFIHNVQLSSLLVALTFTFISVIYLYKLVLLDYDRKTALRAVWFFNIFPTSYFLQAGYTESLFLTSSIAAFYYYRKQELVRFSLSGLFASLTRVNGITLIPGLLAETKSLKQLPFLLSIVLGTALYLTINYINFGSFFYFTEVLELNWYKHFSFPWEGIRHLVYSIPPISESSFYIYFSELFTIAFLLFLTPLIYFRLRKSYGIFVFINLFLMTSTSFILSTPRYALTLFPIYIYLAQIKNQWFFGLLSIISILGLLYFSNLFIMGQWAF